MMNKFQQSGMYGWTHIWHIFHHQHLIIPVKKIHIEFCQNQRTEKVRPEILTALLMKINLMGYDTASTVTNIADDMVSYPKRNTSWKDLENESCKMACLQEPMSCVCTVWTEIHRYAHLFTTDYGNKYTNIYT